MRIVTRLFRTLAVIVLLSSFGIVALLLAQILPWA